MNFDVGPVAPASAVAWIEWSHERLRELRNEPASRITPSVEVLDDVGRYLEKWMSRTGTGTIDENFQWHAEIEPEELEYLAQAFFELDMRLLADAQLGQRSGAPDEGRAFYLVLVHALLHALEIESPGRAAFVDQLRSSWPSAAEAR